MRALMGAAEAALLTMGSLAATPAVAEIVQLDVTVTSPTGVGFSFPIFTFTNQSTAQQITSLSVSNGPPWDYVYSAADPTYGIVNPAGGTRTITAGQEQNFDANDGCSASIGYNLTGFDPGEFFRFAADPEAPGCGSAVVDVRPFLDGDQLTIGVTFAGGISLLGSDWTKELITPTAGDFDGNQRYRLVLTAEVPAGPGGVPEPATWAMMLLGFGSAGYALRRRKAPMMRIRFA